MKKPLQEQELKAEVEIDQIESEENSNEPLTAEVIHDIGDIADDIYEIVFDTGAANISADAAGKITQAHELLFAALEALNAEDSPATPEDTMQAGLPNKVVESTEVKEKKEVVAEVDDEASAYNERKTIERMRNLSMLGLIARAAVPHLVRLIKDMHAGKNITAPQRKLAIGLLNGLIDITTDDVVFNAARRGVIKKGLDKSEQNG